MEVAIRIFSGRPNPTWKLSQHQVIELLTKISSLNNTERDPIDKGLGYNGFSITRIDELSDLPREIEINDGIILVNYGNNRLAKYIDPTRSLEKWLLRIGAQYLEPKLVEYIEKQIG